VSGSLAIAVHAGDFDRVHYALVMASAAAATDRTVTLFFTGRAVRALTREANGAPGWHALRAAPDGAASCDATFRARGVAGFEELLTACNELGVRLIVCEMALRAAAIETAALRQDLRHEIAGVVTFLNAAAGGSIVFI
jgi:peroxiredoxin family protein